MRITFTPFEFHLHAHPIMPLGRDDSNIARVKTRDLSLSEHCVRISIIRLLKRSRLINTSYCASICCPKWTLQINGHSQMNLTSHAIIIARLPVFYTKLFIDGTVNCKRSSNTALANRNYFFFIGASFRFIWVCICCNYRKTESKWITILACIFRSLLQMTIAACVYILFI